MSAGSTVRLYRSFWRQQQRDTNMQHNILRKQLSCCVKLQLIQLLTRRWSGNLCNCCHRSDCKCNVPSASSTCDVVCCGKPFILKASLLVPMCNTKDKLTACWHAYDLSCLVTQHAHMLVCGNKTAAASACLYNTMLIAAEWALHL